VLVHAFPKADVPLVQLAIDARKDFAFHFELGARLAPLRERGVLILGSGNVVHNLHAIDWSKKELGFEWAHRFDEAARATMTGRPSEAAALRDHADYRRAAPTPEHFIPLLHLAGLASAAKQSASAHRRLRVRLPVDDVLHAGGEVPDRRRRPAVGSDLAGSARRSGGGYERVTRFASVGVARSRSRRASVLERRLGSGHDARDVGIFTVRRLRDVRALVPTLLASLLFVALPVLSIFFFLAFCGGRRHGWLPSGG
jgi:hypothetical protein